MVQVYRFTGLQLKHVLISEHRELQVYRFTFEAPFFIYLYKMSYLKLIDSPEKLWFTGLQVYRFTVGTFFCIEANIFLKYNILANNYVLQVYRFTIDRIFFISLNL